MIVRLLSAAACSSAILGIPAVRAQMPPSPTPVVVDVEQGTLSGDSQHGVDVFRGIPYAAPPVGPLRWKAPQPVPAWRGIRTATANEPACPQPVDPDPSVPNFGGVQGAQSEDCLYLTLFAPANASAAPVVVWLHGGAYFLGAGSLGSYDGTANARDGVITVDVNYRLGSMANFTHPALAAEGDAEGTGNYAMMDAVAALEWVRDNIAAFGGDPGNVTIAGQSAGGGLVTGLLSLPAAEGLYHKALIQSGSLLRPDRDEREASEAVVKALGDIGLGANASADDLRSVSAQTLVATPSLMRGFYFTTNAYNPNATIDALKAGTEQDVPVMVGTNTGEGGFDNARIVADLAGDSGAPAFLYRFDHVPAFRQAEWTKGPIHSAELMFSFNSIDTSSWGGPNADAADRALAEKMQSCWTAFYKMPADSRAIRCADGFVWEPYGAARQAAIFETGGPAMAPAADLPDGPEQTASN